MWHCLPWTLDSNTSWPEAGFSCASRGAIWDVQNAWDRFAGLMDMTQYLQVIHVLWEQQWEAISKGMDTWNKQHLWGTQRLLYLLLPVHIPWCVSGGEAGGFSSPLPVYNPVASKQVSSTGINPTNTTPTGINPTNTPYKHHTFNSSASPLALLSQPSQALSHLGES